MAESEPELWEKYCAAVRLHHATRSLETLTGAIDAHSLWSKAFLNG